jgi:WD40 repeat protein
VKDLDSFQNQAHRFVRSSPDRSQFVTGGGTYQTYSGGRASAPIADTNVYFFSWPGLGQKVVRLGDDFGEITAFEFSPNGKKLIVGSAGGKLAMVDTNTYKIVHRTEVAGSVGSLSASDEKMGAAVIGGKVYIAEDGKATEQAGLPQAVSVALAADGKSMYVGGADGKIRRYQLK